MAPASDPTSTAFERPDVVDSYEDWYRTPYGALVDRIETELLIELLGPLPAGASVLEIGCGTGWFGRRLCERGLRVSGIDPAAAMLARARTRLAVVQGDAARLPFGDRAFDAAYLVSVLDFVPDPVAVLREARRVARGRVAVIALASGSWLALRRRIRGLRVHPIFSQAHFYPRRRLLAMARATGAEPLLVRGALYLPPSLAARAPTLEDQLRRRVLPGAGIVGFALPALER